LDITDNVLRYPPLSARIFMKLETETVSYRLHGLELPQFVISPLVCPPLIKPSSHCLPIFSEHPPTIVRPQLQQGTSPKSPKTDCCMARDL
jgi:hypothetical protein